MAIAEQDDGRCADSGESAAFVFNVAEHRLDVVSPTFSRLTGWTKAQLDALGRTWCDALVEGGDVSDVLAFCDALSTLSAGDTGTLRFRLTMPSGAAVLVDWHASVLATDGNGGVISVLSTLTRARPEVRDESRHLASQNGSDAVEETERRRLQDLGRMTAAVAHDFNNLLTVMSAASELAMDDPESQRDMLQEVVGAVARARELTGQLLSFSRRPTPVRERVDLHGLVSESARMIGRLMPESIRLCVVLPDEPMYVSGVGTQLQQVLLNLALNARDAMGASGHMTIRLERRSGHLGARDTALLSVTDTGCGMSDAVRSKMLEPFFTTKPAGQGTGLGMATVKQILGQHHGTIEVTSCPGEGTTIVVGLPLARAASVEKSAEFAVVQPSGSPGGRIAVVDDDPAVLSVTRRVLQRAGYTVMAYEHPKQALLAIETLGADLLLSDMIMPDMVGTELAERVRESCPSIPIVFMTGYSDHHLQGGRWCETPVLSKPFGHKDLLAVVAEALRGTTEERRLAAAKPG